MLRFHTQTGGSTLTAQQPENNIVRVALQALRGRAAAAPRACTPTASTRRSRLPTERGATIALRTQQIIALEAGVTDTADPLAGSYFVEALTDEVEAQAPELIEKIDEMGGAVAAIEAGYMQDEIEKAAFDCHSAVEAGEKVIVGVNRCDAERGGPTSCTDRPGARAPASRAARGAAGPPRRRRGRGGAGARCGAAAKGTQNLLPPMREALAATPPSARCATCCATRGAPTTRSARARSLEACADVSSWREWC